MPSPACALKDVKTRHRTASYQQHPPPPLPPLQNSGSHPSSSKWASSWAAKRRGAARCLAPRRAPWCWPACSSRPSRAFGCAILGPCVVVGRGLSPQPSGLASLPLLSCSPRTPIPNTITKTQQPPRRLLPPAAAAQAHRDRRRANGRGGRGRRQRRPPPPHRRRPLHPDGRGELSPAYCTKTPRENPTTTPFL